MHRPRTEFFSHLDSLGSGNDAFIFLRGFIFFSRHRFLRALDVFIFNGLHYSYVPTLYLCASTLLIRLHIFYMSLFLLSGLKVH